MRRLLLPLIATLLLLSCERNTPSPKPIPDSPKELSESHKYVNNWIYETMNRHYYWNDKMPSNYDISLNHEKFFESLLYRHKQKDGDRFSWIKEDYAELVKSLSGIAPIDIGFLYRAMKKEGNGVYFVVLYVKNGSDAAAKGMRRGDKISKIDGVEINSVNHKSIILNKNTFKISYTREGAQEATTTINTESDFQENPILLSKVFQPKGSNKKIGYLVYNFFSRDAADNTFSYDYELIKIFRDFKNQNINEVVIDLRYNKGGSIPSCRLLASLLIEATKRHELFAELKYNSSVEAPKWYNFISGYPDNQINPRPLPALNINQVFVLTSERTASSSELLINGLRTYMPVVQVGNTTMGKNIGSETFFEKDNPENKWGIQPIVFMIFNSEGKSEYSMGFTPEGENMVDEFDYPIVDFGDFRDPLLNRALTVMGVQLSEKPVKRSPQTRGLKLPDSQLDRPLREENSKGNWQENEMEYPMYIENI